VVLATIVEARRKLEYNLRGQQQKLAVNLVKSRFTAYTGSRDRLWSVLSQWPIQLLLSMNL